jgi:lysophospholipase L1-like esterase
MLGPPPVAKEDQNERISSLSQAYAQEARALGVPFIELFSQLVSDAEYRRDVLSSDGAHPRSGGYIKMAQIVLSSPPSWWFHTPDRTTAQEAE